MLIEEKGNSLLFSDRSELPMKEFRDIAIQAGNFPMRLKTVKPRVPENQADERDECCVCLIF